MNIGEDCSRIGFQTPTLDSEREEHLNSKGEAEILPKGTGLGTGLNAHMGRQLQQKDEQSVRPQLGRGH